MSNEFTQQLEAHHKMLVEEITRREQKLVVEGEELRVLQLKLESVIELMKAEGIAPATAHRHFLEVAHDHLLQHGRMHYVELTRELRDAGVFIPGVKPEANLLAHMSRDARFTKVDRGVYEVDHGNGKRKHGKREAGAKTKQKESM